MKLVLGGKMRSKNNLRLLIKLFAILIILSIGQLVFSQGVTEGDASFMGTILSIPSNFASLAFFEMTIGLSSSTIVLHEDGNTLKVQDLRPGLLVRVEASKDSKGLIAKKIVIQKLRRV